MRSSSAPALLVQSVDGGAGQDLVLSRVRETILDTLDDDKDNNLTEVIGTFNYDYGFMNRGTIAGNGVNVGFNSNGLKIAGSADGTHSTTIEGGVFNGGSITAQSGEGNATAFLFGAGATTPLLVNSGTISAGERASKIKGLHRSGGCTRSPLPRVKAEGLLRRRTGPTPCTSRGHGAAAP